MWGGIFLYSIVFPDGEYLLRSGHISWVYGDVRAQLLCMGAIEADPIKIRQSTILYPKKLKNCKETFLYPKTVMTAEPIQWDGTFKTDSVLITIDGCMVCICDLGGTHENALIPLTIIWNTNGIMSLVGHLPSPETAERLLQEAIKNTEQWTKL